jgi:protein ImuA
MDPMPVAEASTSRPADLQDLHPALWRAHQLGRRHESCVASGFAALDAELPGGGWPCRVLTELLLPHPGVGEMRLLAPVLAHIAAVGCAAGSPRSVMLFDPPAPLCASALAQLGVDARQLLVIHGRGGAHGARHLLASADLLWALEQALKSSHVGAVLAWLPQRLRADALRRLQLAAQSHDGPVFLLRDIDARLKPSAAALRLALHSAGIDELRVRVLKRRGPAAAAPLQLVLPPVLPRAVRARLEDHAVRARLDDRTRQARSDPPMRWTLVDAQHDVAEGAVDAAGDVSGGGPRRHAGPMAATAPGGDASRVPLAG